MPRPLKRGIFHALPNGAGAIKIERSGEIVYRAPRARVKNGALSIRKTKKTLKKLAASRGIPKRDWKDSTAAGYLKRARTKKARSAKKR